MGCALRRGLAFVCLVASSTPALASADDAEAPPSVKVALLQPFMNALREPDFEGSARATLPFVHRSLWNAAGDDLAPDLKRFSFRKAHENAHHYVDPIEIEQVGATRVTSVGAGASEEPGFVVDYYLRRRGRDVAPLRVFFPRGGGPPKVAYMGSL